MISAKSTENLAGITLEGDHERRECNCSGLVILALLHKLYLLILRHSYF